MDFSRGLRFNSEIRQLADSRDVDESEIRRQLLTAMAAVPRPRRGLAELDWHRILDALVLVLRQR